MMKRLYHLLSLLALVNLFALVGLVGYLLASGRLDAERAEQMAKVLRGEWPESEVPASQPAASPERVETSQAEIAHTQAQEEFYAQLAERHRREYDDLLTLNKAVRHQVIRDLEALERQKERFQEEKEAFLAESKQSGFEKELELFEKMSPDMAKDMLRSPSRSDADVVRLLTAMDVNRAKKIIDACKKSPADKMWIAGILEQIPKTELD